MALQITPGKDREMQINDVEMARVRHEHTCEIAGKMGYLGFLAFMAFFFIAPIVSN